MNIEDFTEEEKEAGLELLARDIMMTTTPKWRKKVNYKHFEVIKQKGTLYYALTDNVNSKPSKGGSWQLFTGTPDDVYIKNDSQRRGGVIASLVKEET